MLHRFRFRHRVESSAATLLARLRDLDGVARWAPGVDSSRLLVREGNVSVCDLTFAGAERSLTLEVVYADGRLRFAEVDRLAGHGVDGELCVEAVGDAACAVDLRCQLPDRILWPRRRRRLRQALLMAIGALGRHVGVGGVGGEALVEVASTTPDLLLRIRGRTYRLVPDTGPLQTGPAR